MRFSKVIFLVLISSFVVPAQQKSDDLQKVKDALVNSVILSQELERQNKKLSSTLNQIAEDLKQVKTMVQLDSLKREYGLLDEKKILDSKKKDEKK